MKRIFITGGSGHLGQKLVEYLSINNEVYAPSKEECDILDVNILKEKITSFQPHIVIHAAAFVDTFGCETDIEKAIDVNVIGTTNLVKACLSINCLFVYTSSEYVFGGDKGNYSITDRLTPINVYGKTKSASEYIISILPNYQIIRAPFVRQIYPKAFTDQYCSRYFLDEIIEKIANNIFNNSEKIIHISSERMSLYDLYLKKGIKAEPIAMSEEQKETLPKDTSLINNSI
jgi:dTDP-4-dehydrorhamnose reductase